MKILILSDVNNAHTQRWVKALLKHNIKLKVFSFFSASNNDIKIEIISPRLERFISPKSNSLSKILYFFSIPFLLREIKKFKPDIVHAHYVSSYGLVGSLVNYKPFIISIWGSDISDKPWKFDPLFHTTKFALKKCDKIFVTSEFIKKTLNNYGKFKPIIIPFGYSNNQKFKKVNKKHLTLGIVKRLEKEAGVDRFLYIVENLYKKFTNLRVLIVGSGSEEKKLKALSFQLKIDSITKFVGNVPESKVINYYKEIDIAIFPSRAESFGVSQIEAMSLGIPVIANNVGGVSEIIRNRETGILINNFDRDLFVKAILEIIHNPKYGNRIGSKAKSFVEKNFNIENLVKYQIEHYKKLK